MKVFGINENGSIKNFELICKNCGSPNCDIIPTHTYDDRDLINPKEVTITLRCRECNNEYSCEI